MVLYHLSSSSYNLPFKYVEADANKHVIGLRLASSSLLCDVTGSAADAVGLCAAEVQYVGVVTQVTVTYLLSDLRLKCLLLIVGEN